jgi:hypothetical protein
MVKSYKKLKTLKTLKTLKNKKQNKTKGKSKPKPKSKVGKKVSKIVISVQKPVVLYSKNPLTGEETVVQTQQINGDKFKSFMMKSESEIPPTIYKSNNGSTTFSMSKKRQMVVQSYSSMQK